MKIEQPYAVPPGPLTVGTLTRDVSTSLRRVTHKFSWTNAMVAALAGTTGNIAVCTLPAKTKVDRALIVITGAAASVTGLTVSLGRVGTGYIDWVTASNAKAAANTVYGDAIAEVGSGLSDAIGDLPSLTATTDVFLQFVSSVENLSAVTASTGSVYLETTLLP